MQYVKLVALYLMRTALKCLYIFPVNRKRIYFTANRGTSISCNPKYIYDYMKEKYGEEFEYIWEYDKKVEDLKGKIKIAKPYSISSFYYLLTSKFIISNDGLGSYVPKRASQCFINTWHGGGAYKRVGVDFAADRNPIELKINQICGKQTNVFISSCSKFSEAMSEAKMVPRDRFMECGMPRNDFLINGTSEDIVGKVKKYFKIPNEKKIVLFAPTYRGQEQTANFNSDLEIEGCLNALEKRFGGEWVFLMRKHHFVKTTEYGNCINASEYPDMQELLYAVDVFITDYSSTIWDYSLTFKPGFLFAPDIDQYGEERSFYTSPETWAFPVAKTNEELHELICKYEEEKNKLKIKKHHELLGKKETGRATEIIVEELMMKKIV